MSLIDSIPPSVLNAPKATIQRMMVSPALLALEIAPNVFMILLYLEYTVSVAALDNLCLRKTILVASHASKDAIIVTVLQHVIAVYQN